MSTVKEFDDVFSEGQQPPPENPAVALRAERDKQESAALGEFMAEFGKDEAAVGEQGKN